VDEKFDLLYGALVDRPGASGLTVEALRNLLGRSFAARLALPVLLTPGGRLRASRMLSLDGERVRLNPELAAWLCGRPGDEPEFSREFPAVRLRTVHDLDDLVLPADVRDRLDALLDRIRAREQVLREWGFAARHDNAAGLHVLFHGPPGTGKTMAAAVIGAQTGLPVYRIDLSLVVSKYIGETEKNLAQVFERAEARDWILFFDEADALFGRRGEVSDARDRYANQEVSYLLQRLETFAGVTILATNFLRNVDEAFLRRIHVHVPFRAPDRRERAELWRAVLPPAVPLDAEVDLELVAEEFDLTGGEIRNAAFHAAFRAAADGGVLTAAHLHEGIRGEYEKGGRMFPSR
jgi:ATPase family associated with various cellular activities (AAA)